MISVALDIYALVDMPIYSKGYNTHKQTHAWIGRVGKQTKVNYTQDHSFSRKLRENQKL